MSGDKSGIVNVKSHTRGDARISAHTRSSPGSGSFKTNRTIATGSENNIEDTLNLKYSMKDLGLYEEPSWGMQGFADQQMFESIKTFQKQNGLKVDGIIKPDGPTEKAINDRLNSKNNYNLLTGIVVEGMSELYGTIKA
ncbi:MAG: peptidoglycan-binding protein, partial [Lactobacillus sp.]|nr:peptidoglycan-binding protein [Lactobacillus sp.]